MLIRRCLNQKEGQALKLKRKNGGYDMEMRKETTTYKVANKKDIMKAINRCTKKYETALKNLAK